MHGRHQMNDIVLPSAYRFAGVHCGVRPERGRPDLALIVSDRPAAAAGVFTQNRVVAAPVVLCRRRLPRSDARGVVVCSGNANACTGEQGHRDAERMSTLAAQAVGCRPEQMLVASTGVIGRPLPMQNIETGIRTAAAALADTPDAFQSAAQAILTTDTRVKIDGRSLALSAGEVRVVGFAKGAAMIGPNLATMLAFLVTDAAVAPPQLHDILRRAADKSFNRISVEGHTSTNDTVLLFANGTGPALTDDDLHRFGAAVSEICVELARFIAADGEGSKHLVTIVVEGLRTDDEARRVAKAVADSALVKTAIYGADPNWGRFVSAAGYAGVEFEEKDVSCMLGDIPLYRAGMPLPFDAAAASAYLKDNREVILRLTFSLGTAGCTFWTCDLTPEYVRLNADYTT
jgi:glutamate N-acetyltransferase / amino-acid N-acetyltransferase